MEIVKEVDLVLLVTEPTPFGLHDLVLAVEMARALGKPVTAVVNRSDLGRDHTHRYLASQQIEMAAEIPFRPEVAEAYAHGQIAAAASTELQGLLKLLGHFAGHKQFFVAEDFSYVFQGP